MDHLKMARRLRKLADHLEHLAQPELPEPSIRQVEVQIWGYDKDGNGATLSQFFVLTNNIFTTGRIPVDLAAQGIMVQVRPML